MLFAYCYTETPHQDVEPLLTVIYSGNLQLGMLATPIHHTTMRLRIQFSIVSVIMMYEKEFLQSIYLTRFIRFFAVSPVLLACVWNTMLYLLCC
jgi:hypothetical protein